MLFSGNQKISNTTEREMMIECSCGTHLIKIVSFDDEPEFYFEIWSSNFCSKQKRSFFGRIWNRLKMIWFAISGKEYLLDDIILNKLDMEELANTLQEMIKSKQEVNVK